MKSILKFSFIISICLLVIILSSCGKSDKEKSSITDRDTLIFKIEKVDKKYGNCKTAESRCVTINLKYPVFRIKKKFQIDSLNKFMKGLIINGEYEGDESSSIEEMCKTFYEDYKSQITEFPDYTIPWSLERTIDVIFNSPGMVSIRYYEFSFAGGAHPNYTTSLFTYSTKKHRFIKLNNLFPELSQLKKLNILAEKKFRQIKNISKKSDLAEEGFWFDNNKFRLNDNFAVVKDGLIFFFNSYEIGPYAIGTTELFLSNEELKPIMKSKKN